MENENKGEDNKGEGQAPAPAGTDDKEVLDNAYSEDFFGNERNIKIGDRAYSIAELKEGKHLHKPEITPSQKPAVSEESKPGDGQGGKPKEQPGQEPPNKGEQEKLVALIQNKVASIVGAASIQEPDLKVTEEEVLLAIQEKAKNGETVTLKTPVEVFNELKTAKKEEAKKRDDQYARKKMSEKRPLGSGRSMTFEQNSSGKKPVKINETDLTNDFASFRAENKKT